MPNQTINYQCPACGGTMHFDGTIDKLVCDFCESTFTAAEIEALYASQQQQADAAAAASDARAVAGTMSAFEASGNVGGEGVKTIEESLKEAQTVGANERDAIHAFLDRAAWNEQERAGLRTFTCSACGAALTVDAATAVTECPYCGNTTILPGQLADDIKPDKVIPFKFDRDTARTTLAEYYHGKKFLPNAFASSNRIAHVQGVYVPFWLYDAEATGRGSYEATRSRTYVHGDWQITETKVYDVERAGSLAFTRVPADASSKMPNTHMDAIEPYDYRDMKDFSIAYLPGYAAERFDLKADTAECKGRVESRMKQSMADALYGSVAGYSSVTTRSSEAYVDWDKVSYALLPVWLLHTQWNGTDFLFAMNGQTGRLIGDLPIDNKKVVAWFAGIYLVTLVVCYLLCTVAMEMEVDALYYAVMIGVPALTAGLICSMFYADMKTARERHEASDYITQAGLQLAVKHDRYVTTRTSRVHIERGGNRKP